MPPFEPVAKQPDHIALEHRVLERWERERTFETLRDRNRGGPPFSFIDGPITANNPMGVHHGWGRTLKDVWQRYHAMQGHDLLYQNGFDCQGLWVEVGVEKELGLNSKREIEAYGLDRFARACRDRVALYAGQLTEHSKRLGQWMDWERSYYTMTDPNISYIWGFLKECHEREWLYRGHRSMPWCPRCGTSLSQHELIDSYKEITHPSLHVRLPLRERDREYLVVWTTTPWTLPANVAAAVRPDADYVRVSTPAGIAYVAAARLEQSPVSGTVLGTVRGSELVGLTYTAPFDDLPAQAGFENRVVAWEDVSMDEGTGIVHIAPGCGEEDFELGRREGLETLIPVDEAGAFTSEYGWLHGHVTAEAAQMIVDDLGQRARLVAAGEITHRYPVCWRCGTELIYRLVDEWFIRCEEIRQPMIDAARGVEWTPRQYGKRMEDWLVNMGDWCISRKRYWGLPLPFYFCDDGHMTVIGSQAELLERAVRGTEGLEELHRPWIDDVVIRCGECGGEAHRLPEVGDCWLDAGVVPFSTLGWHNDTFVEAGYAAGAGVGVTIADLPDHANWERWYPADWVSEMREQIRLWFYSMLFMGVVLDGRAPYKRVLTYEKVNDETGRPMHKSWGNAIWFEDAIEDMGADVMRWMYAGQQPGPEPELRLRPRRRGEAEAPAALEHVLVLRHVREHRGLHARLRAARDRARPGGGAAARPLARRAHPVARRRVPRGARHVGVAARRARVRDVHRRPLELVRAPVADALLALRRPGRHARRLRGALVRARAGAAVRLAGDAVPDRRDVAEPRPRRLPGRAGGHPPGRLSGGARGAARSRARRGDGERARGGRARPPQPRRRRASSCASRCAR